MAKQKYLGVVNVSAVLQAQKDIQKDDRYKLAIEAFAKRERFYAVNAIAHNRIFYYQSNKWFTPKDATSVYKWLQDIGVGAIRMNLETKKPVFVFFTDYRDFGKLVLGKNDKLLRQLVAEKADLPLTPVPRIPMPELGEASEEDVIPSSTTTSPEPKTVAPATPAIAFAPSSRPQATKPSDELLYALHDFVNSIDTVLVLKTLSPTAKSKFLALLELL